MDVWAFRLFGYLVTMNLFDQIKKKVQEIPVGKVATYDLIAKMVGTTDARKVGWAIHDNQDTSIPCHRVVFSDGKLAENYSMGGWEEQRRKLEEEGIVFETENRVNLDKYLWIEST